MLNKELFYSLCEKHGVETSTEYDHVMFEDEQGVVTPLLSEDEGEITMSTPIKTFDTEKAIEAQAKLCDEKEYPHFAPLDGRCWSCGSQIYQEKSRTIGDRTFTSGISVEGAGSSLITGCPHCSRSYCD